MNKEWRKNYEEINAMDKERYISASSGGNLKWMQIHICPDRLCPFYYERGRVKENEL